MCKKMCCFGEEMSAVSVCVCVYYVKYLKYDKEDRTSM